MEQEIPHNFEHNDQNKVVIDISVKTAEDLFNKFDQNTSGIPQKLNQELADYIIDSARDAEEKEFILKIKIENIPDEKVTCNIENSLLSYFNNLKKLENNSIENMFGRSFKLFGLGIVFLFIALIFNRHFSISEGILSQIFYEGSMIVGWVSLWASIVTIIIKWPQQKNNIKLYEKIMKAQIIFHR